MARQAPRRKEHHVDANIIIGSRKARAEHFCGCGDAAQAKFVDRHIEIGGAVAPFHFDESEGAAAPRHQIDFARGNAQPFACLLYTSRCV